MMPAGKIMGLVFFAALVVFGVIMFRQMRGASDYSAHAALAAEIQSNLVFLSHSGSPFPRTLAELPLRYPDGGDTSLLRRFEYSSSGTGCTVRTRLPYADTDTIWSF